MTKDLKNAFNNKRDHWFRCLNSGFKNLEDLKKYRKLKTRVKESIKAIKLANGSISTDVNQR